MKKLLMLSAILIGLSLRSQTESETNLKNGFGVGFQLVQYHNDFGLGLNVSSPFVAKESLGFRLKTNLMFLEHLEDTITTWTPYSNVSLGLIGVGGMVGKNIRCYGEGGAIVLFPSSHFSSASTLVGGYGLFGFEFFMADFFNYFIEIGGVGIGAVADKVPTQPIYSNGLSISTGFRCTL